MTRARRRNRSQERVTAILEANRSELMYALMFGWFTPDDWQGDVELLRELYNGVGGRAAFDDEFPLLGGRHTPWVENRIRQLEGQS